MESITRPRLASGKVVEIARHHLRDAPSKIEEVLDGWFSGIFRLEMPDGDKFILKVAPAKEVRLLRYEVDAMTTEVRSMRLIRERSTVPVPRIVCHDTSHEIIPHDYFIAETLPGIGLNKVWEEMDEASRARVDGQIGRHLRQLHEIHGPGFGPFAGPLYPSMPEAFAAIVRDLEADATDFSVEGVSEGLSLALTHADVLAEVSTPSLVHWDLNDGNVIVDSGEVTGYIDFERALWADPLLEYNFLWPRPGLLEGYGEEFSSAVARRNLYELYLALIWVIEYYSRGFPAEHEKWARGKLGGCGREFRLGLPLLRMFKYGVDLLPGNPVERL